MELTFRRWLELFGYGIEPELEKPGTGGLPRYDVVVAGPKECKKCKKCEKKRHGEK